MPTITQSCDVSVATLKSGLLPSQGTAGSSSQVEELSIVIACDLNEAFGTIHGRDRHERRSTGNGHTIGCEAGQVYRRRPLHTEPVAKPPMIRTVSTPDRMLFIIGFY